MLHVGRMVRHVSTAGVALATAVVLVGGVSAFAFAHTADDNTIHACYRTEPGSGHLRIVSANQTCKKNEKAIQWNITGPQGPPGPAGPRCHNV